MATIDNTGFYTLLGVQKTATPGEIKRAYYVKARVCHPDKNPDNPQAEAEFKELSEAYQVLSDPQKKEIYDKYGKAGLDQSAVEVSPKLLFQILFGGPAFEELIGEMSMGLLMTLTAQPKPEGKTDDEMMEEIEKAIEDATKERITFLTHKLLIRIEPLVQGEDISDAIREDVLTKLEAPGGGTLLDIIGYIYQSEAKKKLKSFLGLGKLAASLRQKGHNISQTWKMAKSAVSVSTTSSRLEELEGVEGPEAEAERAALEEKLTQVGMTAMWRLGEMEIENVTRQVCAAVLYDSSVTSELRQKRAAALEKIGHIYKKMAKKFIKSGADVVAELAKELDEDPSQQPEAGGATGSSTTASSSSTTTYTATSSSSSGSNIGRKSPLLIADSPDNNDKKPNTTAATATTADSATVVAAAAASEESSTKKKKSKFAKDAVDSISPRSEGATSPRSEEPISPRPVHVQQNSLSETLVSEKVPDNHQTLSNSADVSLSLDQSEVPPVTPVIKLPPPDHPIKMDDSLSVSMSASASTTPNVADSRATPSGN